MRLESNAVLEAVSVVQLKYKTIGSQPYEFISQFRRSTYGTETASFQQSIHLLNKL
jgi:hypothetical protein